MSFDRKEGIPMGNEKTIFYIGPVDGVCGKIWDIKIRDEWNC